MAMSYRRVSVLLLEPTPQPEFSVYSGKNHVKKNM